MGEIVERRKLPPLDKQTRDALNAALNDGFAFVVDRGNLKIDEDAVIAVVLSDRIPLAAKVICYRRSIFEYLIKRCNGEIGARGFGQLIRSLAKFDTTNNNDLFRIAVRSLNEDIQHKLCEGLSHTAAEQVLRYRDIGFCSPERMARYIRDAASRFMQYVNKLDDVETPEPPPGNIIWSQVETSGGWLRWLLGKACERDEGEPDSDFLHETASQLIVNIDERGRSYKGVPSYIIQALERLRDDWGSETAEDFLSELEGWGGNSHED